MGKKLKTSGYSSNFLQEFSTDNDHLSLFEPINCFRLIYRACHLFKDFAFRWCIDSTRTERHESNKWNEETEKKISQWKEQERRYLHTIVFPFPR